MDEHWKHYTLGRERTTKELPSTYWKRQCVVSCEGGEELIGCFVEHVGDDYLVMATDYPHADARRNFPSTRSAISAKIAPCPRQRDERSCGTTPPASTESPLFCVVSSPSEPGRGHGEGA